MPLDATPQTNPERQPPPPLTNWAPIAPLRDVEEPKAYEKSSVVQAFRELHNDVKNRYIDVRRDIAEVGRLMGNLISGKLLMKRDPMYGGLALLKPLPFKPRKDRHVLPLAQVNASQLTSIWTLSRPRITPRHFGNNNKAQIQQALIERVVDHYDVEIFDEIFNHREMASMMLYGTTAIRVFPDDNLNTVRELQPIFENSEQTVFPGHAYCPECLFDGQPEHFKGPSPEFPQCPDCGTFVDPQTMVVPQKGMVAQVVGQKEIKQGDIGGELLHIPGCNWDMRKLAHESPYFCYRSEVSQNLVRSLLGIDVQESGPDDDYGLRVMNSLGSRGGSTEDTGRDDLWGHPTWKSGAAILDEEYYAPEMYAGMKLEKDEKTVSGEVIPKGVPWEQIWPDGVCISGFNDMEIVISLHNEKRHLVGSVYHYQSHSGYGKGTADAIEIGEQINIAHSANLAILKRYGAGGGYWFDKRVMSRKEATTLLTPDGLVGIDMRGTGYKNVGEALQQLQHNPQNQESLAFIAQMSNFMNIVFQTTDFTQGTADQKVDVNTLGGQQMLHAQNQQRSAAVLRLKGWSRALIFEDLVEIFRDYIVLPKFFGANDKFAMSNGRMIAGADMPQRVKMDFVVDSEIPTNTYVKRENTVQMLKESAGFGIPFGQLSREEPRLAAWWVGQFPGVEIPLFNQTNLLITCQDWMDRLTQATQEVMQRAQVSGFYPEPEDVAKEIVGSLNLPKSAENQAVKAELIKEYLDSDEAKQWPPVQMAAVEMLIQQLYENDSANRMRVPAIDTAAQAKMAADAHQQMGGDRQPDPKAKLIESMAYKDAPPDIQRQMEQQAGFQPSQAGGSSPLEGHVAKGIHTAQANQPEPQTEDPGADMHREVATRGMDEIQSESEFNRQEKAKQADHQRNLELEKMKQRTRPTMGPKGRK